MSRRHKVKRRKSISSQMVYEIWKNPDGSKYTKRACGQLDDLGRFGFNRDQYDNIVYIDFGTKQVGATLEKRETVSTYSTHMRDTLYLTIPDVRRFKRVVSHLFARHVALSSVSHNGRFFDWRSNQDGTVSVSFNGDETAVKRFMADCPSYVKLYMYSREQFTSDKYRLPPKDWSPMNPEIVDSTELGNTNRRIVS